MDALPVKLDDLAADDRLTMIKIKIKIIQAQRLTAPQPGRGDRLEQSTQAVGRDTIEERAKLVRLQRRTFDRDAAGSSRS
jgi:hypothetical protein